ncbi:hypothetical protein RKD38_007337 [Streptomyces ambofaciens]
MAGVITASEPSWIGPFSGLNPRQFGKLVTVLRREGADAVRKGRPWSLPLEDRALLVAAYWRTNLIMRQLAPLFRVSKSATDRIIDHLGPMLALQPRKRFAKDTVLIVDGTLVSTRDHTIAEQSKNYRYSTNYQVVIDADTRLVVVVGRPLAGNRNDCKGWEESGAKAAVGKTLTIVDGGYPGTGLVIPHRRERGQSELPDWKEEHNKSRKQVRTRVEHVSARMKTWKILRDCRLKGNGIHHAMLESPGCTTSPSPDRRPAALQPAMPESTRRSFKGQPLGRGRQSAGNGRWPSARGGWPCPCAVAAAERRVRRAEQRSAPAEMVSGSSRPRWVASCGKREGGPAALRGNRTLLPITVVMDDEGPSADDARGPELPPSPRHPCASRSPPCTAQRQRPRGSSP